MGFSAQVHLQAKRVHQRSERCTSLQVSWRESQGGEVLFWGSLETSSCWWSLMIQRSERSTPKWSTLDDSTKRLINLKPNHTWSWPMCWQHPILDRCPEVSGPTAWTSLCAAARCAKVTRCTSQHTTGTGLPLPPHHPWAWRPFVFLYLSISQQNWIRYDHDLCLVPSNFVLIPKMVVKIWPYSAPKNRWFWNLRTVLNEVPAKNSPMGETPLPYRRMVLWRCRWTSGAKLWDCDQSTVTWNFGPLLIHLGIFIFWVRNWTFSFDPGGATLTIDSIWNSMVLSDSL